MRAAEAISPARREDLPRLLEVWEASVRATHRFLTESEVAALVPLVREAFLAEDFLESVAVSCVRSPEGEVVGFSGVADGKLEMLFLHPAWRGRGLGSRLLRHAIEVHGADRVDVNEQNEQAVGFYLRRDFEVEGRSELDGQGRPFPLLHLRLKRE